MQVENPSAADLVALEVGDRFTYRGVEWVLADHRGWTWGEDARGEYARFSVWPGVGGYSRFITVRPRD